MSNFAIWIDNSSYPVCLIVGKVYRVLPDEHGEMLGMLRLIDEDKSEPDGYLYPTSMFVPIDLPDSAARALMAVDG